MRTRDRQGERDVQRGGGSGGELDSAVAVSPAAGGEGGRVGELARVKELTRARKVRTDSDATAARRPVLSSTPARIGTPGARETRPEKVMGPEGWLGGGRVNSRRCESVDDVSRCVD